MIRKLRSIWRTARGSRTLGPLLEGVDRLWWSHTIRRSNVIDMDFVAAQFGEMTRRAAVRRYVRDGFRHGMSLNPLFTEDLVSRQLSDSGRVPALYAYIVNDKRGIRTSVSWDASIYVALHPESLRALGGPVGHAWRAARADGWILLGTSVSSVRVSWEAVMSAARAACSYAREPQSCPAPAIPSGNAFVCVIGQDERGASDALTSVAIVAKKRAFSVVVALSGRKIDDWTAAFLLSLWVPNVRVTRYSDRFVTRIIEGESCGSTLLVRGPDSEISGDDLVRLADMGMEAPTAPLWLAPDGTVASAGLGVHKNHYFHILQNHPVEDALAIGPWIPSCEIAANTYAMRRAPFERRGVRTSTEIVVRAPRALETSRIPATCEAPETEIEALFQPLGLTLERWGPRGPVLRRPVRLVSLPDGRTAPSYRWAIRIAAPPGPPGESWGETHFARGLAAALRRLGQEVVIDAYAARSRPSRYLDDVVLALRGPEIIEPQQDAYSILWIISHPDEITADELSAFDRVYAASPPWASEASFRLGRPIEALLQCTDANRFRPSGTPRSHQLIFVGTARGIARPSIVEPIRNGIPVSVYGPDWRGYIPAEAIKGIGVPNSALPVMYESAAAVLNDHWPAMRTNGFVSNRLYDVVAAGGRAVSDSVQGIDSLFDGAVLTYDSIPELLEILSGNLDEQFPDEQTLARISSMTRQHHSFDARARTLLDGVLRERGE